MLNNRHLKLDVNVSHSFKNYIAVISFQVNLTTSFPLSPEASCRDTAWYSILEKLTGPLAASDVYKAYHTSNIFRKYTYLAYAQNKRA